MVGEEGGKKGTGSALGWQARNEQVMRSARVVESDWIRTGLVTHRKLWGRTREGKGGGDANASGNADVGGSPVVSMDAEKSARREGVVFFQSSNLLNLFFPRNVAAVSKLLIAIGKVEPMWDERGVELSGGRRRGSRGGGG